MFVNRLRQNEQSVQRTFHRCFLPSFGVFDHAVSEEIFRNRPIRNKNCLWWPCLLTDWDKLSNLYKRTFHRCFLPSFGSFGHAVSEEILRNRPIRNKNRLWWPCLLMDRDGMSIFFIEDHPQKLPTKFRIIQPSGFRREEFFSNQPIRNKRRLWQPCSLTDRDKMSNLYGRPSIDGSYQVSVHLAKWFQRRSFLKQANQKQELPVVAMFVNGSEQNEHSLQRTFHRCFLPSFSSQGQGVSEEKIKM